MKHATLYLALGALALAAPGAPTFAGPGHGAGDAASSHAATPTMPEPATTRGPDRTQQDTTTQDQKGPDQTGQPNVECGEEDALNRPGNSESAPGSAFNPDGTAGEHYAGEQPQNSKNTASVSQYDTACAHAKSK